MDPLSLNEIKGATQGALNLEAAGGLEIRDISSDTRTLPEGALYVPLSGENFDGHDFIRQAVEKGAAAYLTEKEPLAWEGREVPAIRVKSCISAFMHMAHHYRSKFDLPVVGITGSNGKTTTKELLGWVLAEEGPTIYSERSFNNYVGVPLTLFRIESDTKYAVLELGTNSPGEIAVLTGLAAPEVGLITNISDCHLAGLKNREGIIREKSDLFAGLAGQNVSVLNRDDPAYDQLVQAATGKVVTFGICHRSDYTAIHIDVDFQGVSFEVEGVQVQLPLLGFHSIYNALGAYACARELGVSPERIASVFQRFESPPMRLKPIQQGSLFVVNDAYNANPGSMESAIKTFSVLPAEGRKVVVLGDMLELADQSPSLHRKVGEQLGCGDFDLVVAVGDRAREYLVGAGRCGVPEEKLVSFEDTDKAMQTFPDLISPNDSILVKGSRKMGLERLVEAVLAVGI